MEYRGSHSTSASKASTLLSNWLKFPVSTPDIPPMAANNTLTSVALGANLPVATTQVYVLVRRFQAPSDAAAAAQWFELQLQNGIEDLGETNHRSITHEDRSGFALFTAEQYDVVSRLHSENIP